MTVLIWVILILLGVIIGWLSRWTYAKFTLTSVEQRVRRTLANVGRDAETLKKDILYETREQLQKEKSDQERGIRDRYKELNQTETRLQRKEDLLDNKLADLEKGQTALQSQEDKVRNKNFELEKREATINSQLETISKLTREEAKQLILTNVEARAKQEIQDATRRIEQEAIQSAERKGKELIVTAAQRLASEVSAEITMSSVQLPNDEMKGRIIGKDGRNIRTIETLTGADIIIDDTPDAVVVSCFNPVRRAIAVQTISSLVRDGRIHPGRIEEEVVKATQNLNKAAYEEGEKAFLELGIHGTMHTDGLRSIGRLKFRTSYGQNVLNHSKEVATLAGIIAKEIGHSVNVDITKRGALLHDVGKGLDSNSSLTHVELGVELAKRMGEGPEVINCIAAHHGDVPYSCLESVIVQTADAISAARPGARRETLESYIERLEKLETIANELDGVHHAYAVHAGRELRVIIKSSEVSDNKVQSIAQTICRKVEDNLKYPGRVKVVAIRETRITEYAR